MHVLSLVLDWDREKLLEAWMLDADGCCQRSGVAMPTPPPCGYNAWDTLPSPRTPKTPRSPLTLTLTSPTDSCLTPGEEGLSTVSHWGLFSSLTFCCYYLLDITVEMSSVYLKIKSFGDIVALLHIIFSFSCFCPLSLFLLFSYVKTILGAHLTDHHFISFTLVG